MKADIVEDGDIARRHGRGELGFDPGLEDAAVHGRIDDPRRDHRVGSETGDEGLRLPGAERRMAAVTLPPSGTIPRAWSAWWWWTSHQ